MTAPLNPTHPASYARRTGWRSLELHTQIDIDAAPERIWAALTDFPAYAAWNPCIPRAAGTARAGSRLEVEIAWPGLKRGPYVLRVVGAQPARELRWLGHLGRPGLMDGDHRFTIEPLGSDRARLIQTERFSGWLVPLMAPWLRRNVLVGFERMNTALKARVEGVA